MKLVLKEKNLKEQEEDLKTHKFSKQEIEKRVEQLDQVMHRVAMPLQEKVPLQVAQEYFLKYPTKDKISLGDVNQSAKIGDFVDEQGLVRIADIFILSEIHNNLDLDWMLQKYK